MSEPVEVNDLEIPDSLHGRSTTEFYICPNCGKVSHDNYRLKTFDSSYICSSECRNCHISLHTVDFPERCTLCGKMLNCLNDERQVVILFAMSTEELYSYEVREVQELIKGQSK